MARAKGEDRVSEMVGVLRDWQGLERQAINDTAEIMEQVRNPFLRIILEIIRSDSLMHHRVQQFLIDAVEREAPALTRDELADIWEKIEAHDRVERKTIELAEGLKANAWSPIHRQLLDYLLTDERKHDSLLAGLNELKKGMSKASGG